MGLFTDVQAQAIEQERIRRPELSTVIGVLIGRLIRRFFGLLWSLRVTILWAALLGVISVYDWRYAGLILLLLGAVMILYRSNDTVLKALPFSGDITRWSEKRAIERRIENGNQFLRQSGLVRPDDELYYHALLDYYDDRVEFNLRTPIPNVPSQTIIEKAKLYKDRFSAKTVRVQQLGGGALQITWITREALDEVKTIHRPAPFDAAKMSVECAVNAFGEPFALKFRETSGALIAGMAGSGKTAGVSSFLLPMALSKDCELTIIDGKGGTDWSAYAPAAKRHITVAEREDYTQTLDILRTLRDEMVTRLAEQKELYGGISNYWNAELTQRRAHNQPFKLVVIDEAQELFHPAFSDKEMKQVAQETTELITTLVKRGRSAGVCLMLITQKPTSDAIPTAVRDNCQVKVAFKLDTAEAEKSALGTIPDDLDLPRAMEIPKERRGGAVVVRDDGTRESVRFYFMPEQDQARLLGGEAND